jgi:hypothetical protein
MLPTNFIWEGTMFRDGVDYIFSILVVFQDVVQNLEQQSQNAFPGKGLWNSRVKMHFLEKSLISPGKPTIPTAQTAEVLHQVDGAQIQEGT